MHQWGSGFSWVGGSADISGTICHIPAIANNLNLKLKNGQLTIDA